MANTNRTKGHAGERLYAKEFKLLGYKLCVTSRYGSRQHDDSGIDLINIPFNVQVKVGKQKAMKPHLELKNIAKNILEKFPEDHPVHDYPKLVIHRRECGRGKRRTEFDDTVTMSFEDFKRIIQNNGNNNNTPT